MANSETKTLSASAKKLVCEISLAELAVRMCEASYGLTRPPKMTAAQALDAMEDDCRDGWHRAARAAMEYWAEVIGGAKIAS